MSEDGLLYEVAKLHYEKGLTQLQISKRVKTSRSTISRLLQRAIEKHIVTIEIKYPWRRNTELEQELMKRFKLRAIRVLGEPENYDPGTLAGTGALAAQMFDEVVRSGDIVGVSYGRSVASTASALRSRRLPGLTVVPILGALGSGNNDIDGPELVRQFAKAYRGRYQLLPGPLLLKDEKTRDLLAKLPEISDTLAIARKARVVVIGIGNVHQKSPIWNGYLDKRGMEWVMSRGAIGHMCGQFYDENGQIPPISTNQRSLSIGLKTLCSIESVIAIASGADKAAAILGAIRGRFLNMLVTDTAAGSALLTLK